MYRATYGMAEAEERLMRFEELLRRHGIEIDRGSDLERLALSIVDVLDKHRQPELQEPGTDIRAWLREALGLNHLIALILDVAEQPEFGQLVPHLHLLNTANSTQNAWAPVTDASSNKLFELVLACAGLRGGHAVELDHPERSTGDNPDVLLNPDTDQPFGVACKTLHSGHPRTILDNVEKAASQIEVSPATRGVVALNIKNLFPHDELFPILNETAWRAGEEEPEYGAWNDQVRLLEQVNLAADEVFAPLRGDDEQAELKRIFEEYPKALPGIVVYVHTAVGVSIGGSALPTNFGFLKLTLLDQPLDPTTMGVLEDLNQGMQIA